MTEWLRRLCLPAYLLLCLLLGGSVRSVWPNMVLQLLAVALIAWTGAAHPANPIAKPARMLLGIACAALCLVVVQLVPLPPGLWTSLPGRESLAVGFSVLGLHMPWLPLSLAPYATLGSALAILPPLGVTLAMLRQPQEGRWLVGAVIVGAFANVLLATVQVASGGVSSAKPWYLYDISNNGAVGFFANSNHLGSLLLAGLAFAVALTAIAWSERRRGRAPMLLAGASALVAILAGLALNHSLAAVALAAPTLLLSALLFPAGWKLRRIALPVAAIAAVALVAVLTSSPIGAKLAGHDLSSFQSRSEMWANTFDLVRRTFPVGTGLGSFPSVYPLIEDPASVDLFYVNHAHNDYLEILLEGGLAGVVLVAAFLSWWAIVAVRAWRSRSGDQLARAATIASGAMLAHSVVDYPLRTAALATVFALCLGLMLRAPADRSSERPAVRPARHVKIA